MSGSIIISLPTKATDPKSAQQVIFKITAKKSTPNPIDKEKALLDAITLVESQKLLEPLVKSVLEISPKYVFEKKTVGFKTSYICTMIIQSKKNPKENMYRLLEGAFKGHGLSKRIAQMDACKNAMQEWDTKNGVAIGDMNFAEYVQSVFKESNIKNETKKETKSHSTS